MDTNLDLFTNKKKARPSNGQALTVVGLGALKEGGNTEPKFLREVTVDAISTSDFTKPAAYGGDVFDKSMFCAARNKKDSCQGDSGGPIVISQIQQGPRPGRRRVVSCRGESVVPETSTPASTPA